MSNRGALHAIDANIILRYLLGNDETLSARASEIMKAVEDGRTTVSCDPINLAEVVWVLHSFYKLPNKEIAAGLGPILAADEFIMPNKDRYIFALELLAGPIAHFGDACACAAALVECEGRLYSFDHKLSKIKGITRRESVG